jgi:cyclopropane-fatty-acyl-phospholipid synthase
VTGISHIRGVPRADAARWPDVARVPRGRFRAAVAERLMRHALRRLPVRVVRPGGAGTGDPGLPVLRLHRPDAFHRRLGADGLIGFGEAYQAGDWDADDLPGLLTAFAREVGTLVPRPLQRLRRLYVHRQPDDADGTVRNARHNIARHYDLSTEMFALFLDPSLTYSAGLFDAADDGLPDEERLMRAQRRKIDRLLDLAGVGGGTRVLEIGTGWGELALRAGARGARVDSVTLSAGQREVAARRIAGAGLADRVTVALRDYREVRGTYDAVLSVEMIEAVGYRHWPVYFAALDRLLGPGGRAGLQAITMPHDRMLATRDTHTWIQKYVFPGGLIPSVRAVEEQAARTGLAVADRFAFGADYAETLRIWRDRFAAHAHDLGGLGFDETFRRTWELYLGYSEAGFRSRYLDVRQFLLTRKGTR